MSHDRGRQGRGMLFIIEDGIRIQLLSISISFGEGVSGDGGWEGGRMKQTNCA